MRCLVTGASGFLGRDLVPALSEAGCEITAQYHRGPPPPGVEAAVSCTLPEELNQLSLAGIDVVYHLAGIAHQQADALAYRRVNLDASLALARCALDAGVKRFVFVSSVKAAQGAIGTAYSPGHSATVSEAESPITEAMDYPRSKHLAEQELRALCANTSMQLVVVRPALVYSPEAPGHLGWLRRWAELRLPGLPELGARSMIARHDLTRLLRLLATAEIESPLQLTVTDGEHYSAARLHRAYVSALDRQPVIKRLPRSLWKLAAAALDVARGEVQGTTWQRLAGEEVYAAAGLESLGFCPQYRFESSLQNEGKAAS